MIPLHAIRAVLVRPTHPGNIGGVARALKNMGLVQLYLVAPSRYPSEEATARAAGAEDVLTRAVVCRDLDEAIRDCHYVVGASARSSRHIDWPLLDPAECAARLIAGAASGPVALLFGPERAGLANAELDRCHALSYIPANPDYPSLNLACAAQVFAYEIRRAALQERPPMRAAEPPATVEELEHFYRHLERVLIRIRFLDPENPRLLLRRLRRLYNRAGLDKNEINILRGILTAVDKATAKLDKDTRE